MYVHDDAKMQKHSSQPHNDATDGKKNVICLVYNRATNSMSTKRHSEKPSSFIQQILLIIKMSTFTQTDGWLHQ